MLNLNQKCHDANEVEKNDLYVFFPPTPYPLFATFVFVLSLIKSVAECPQFVPLISTDISNAVLRMVDQGPYHKAAILEDPMTMEL